MGTILAAVGMAAGQDVTRLGDIITASSANHPVGEAPQFVIDNCGGANT